MTTLAFARRHAPERTVIAGALAVHPLTYRVQGAGPAPASLPGLRVRAVGSGEAPIYHPSSGVYGFLRLPPGTHRLHLTDPGDRFLPRAQTVDVPDRAAAVAILAAGAAPPPGAPGPAYLSVAMRPAIGFPLRRSDTAVWGEIRRASGEPLPFARLRLATRLDGADAEVVTYSDLMGVFLARLPGERATFVLPEPVDEDADPPPADDETELIRTFPRALSVHVLSEAALAGVRGADPLAGFPADFDDLDPDAPGSPYIAPAYRLLDVANDTAAAVDPGDPGEVTVQIGQRWRWDIEIA
jgi:hypothetical protein